MRLAPPQAQRQALLQRPPYRYKHGSNLPDERAIEGLNIKGDYRNDM